MNKYVVQYTHQRAMSTRPVLATIRVAAVSGDAAIQDAWPILRVRYPGEHITVTGVMRL
ncbi:hypothetical protein [Paraburkholderia sp. C35]|uniref:hypothetical protein n=1 Tax=Paraburkholderia sp. C35 TaxID=2126993 RepID=UPI0013A5BD8E|nr:hypothetical protein [Paraburkholderia sp. C35]